MSDPTGAEKIGSWISLIRVKQWAKNGIVFAPLLFSASLLNVPALNAAGLAFVAFCLAAGGVYALNDVVDATRDRAHPKKQHRPVASGRISRSGALFGSVLLQTGALVLAYFIAPLLAAVVGAYSINNIVYSMRLRRHFLGGIMSIALGFALRVVAGAVAIDVQVSHWLLLTTVFVAIFLALAKRRQELARIESGGALAARDALHGSTVTQLDQLMVMTGGLVIVIYALFTGSESAMERFSSLLVYTVPVVVYAMFRFFILVQQSSDEDPIRLFMRDPLLLAASVAWLAMVLAALYVVR